MRQVPAFQSYLVIGGGRLARHLLHYFQLLSLPVFQWQRCESEAKLREFENHVSHVLLAVTDSAIEAVYSKNDWLKTKTCVHFSGALSSKSVPSAHPLMTFSEELYDLETYRKIPFVLEDDRGAMIDLLPRLSNPWFAIRSEDKALYHAFCVLSGNFTTLLWEKTFLEFSKKLGLPKSALIPYMERVFKNLAASPPDTSVLTGPLVRGDHETIENHLRVLGEDPFADVYRVFVKTYLVNKEVVQ